MAKTDAGVKKGLLERLKQDVVICAEGYLFECERRGYLQAGAFVPEVVLEHPEVVSELHREFVHAGSDIVEAFTYYGHREKLRIIGKEHLLEPLNRNALALARQVAQETGTLMAGNLSNTNIYAADESTRGAVRAIFDEQLRWAVEERAELLIAETFGYLDEVAACARSDARHRATDRRNPGNSPGVEDSRRLHGRRGSQAHGRRRGGRGRAQLRPRTADDAPPTEGDASGSLLPDCRASGALQDHDRAADHAVASRPIDRCPRISDCARPLHLHSR